MRLLRQGDGTRRPAEVRAPSVGAPRPDRWARLAFRLLVIAGLTGLLGAVPLPLLDDWLPIRNVLVAVFAVTATGKALFDTLFFDRYRP
jgi:hypothetical protein